MADSPMLPQDPDSELALLGCLLLYDSARDSDLPWDFDEIRSVVGGPDCFMQSDHRIVYGVLCRAVDEGIPLDHGTIVPRLQAEGSCNGGSWTDLCVELSEGFADLANAAFYARRLRDCDQARRIIRACSEGRDRAYRGIEREPPGDILADLSQTIEAIEQDRTGDHEPTSEVDLLESMSNPAGTMDKVPVGLGPLSEILGGGLDPGSLCVVGARPSCGKTSLGLGLCVHAGRSVEGCASLFVSAEMSAEQIRMRLLAMRTGLPVHRIRSGRVDDIEFNRERLEAVSIAKTGHAIYVLDRVRDVRAVAAQVKRCVRRYGVKLIVLDYLGLLDLRGKFDRHDLKLAAMTGLFKGLAVDCGAAIVLLCQLNRASENEKRRPRLSDLRDSGAIEQDADVVLLLHKGDASTAEVVDTTIVVAKQRQGGTGDALVCYRKPTMSYEARYVGGEVPF